MIRLYQQNQYSSNEINLLKKLMTHDQWLRIKDCIYKQLRSQKFDKAAELFNTQPFELYEATNGFGDEFSVIYFSTSSEKYSKFADQYKNPDYEKHYERIAFTVKEFGHCIRFIAVGRDTDSGIELVPQPTLSTISDSVEMALNDAEVLIHSSGAVSSVDRIHTAFHGYLKMIATNAGIELEKDANITRIFKLIRENHPAFRIPSSRPNDIENIIRAMSSIINTLNPLRNRASMAHPNEDLLEEPEAILVVNIVRSMLHYINSKLN